jgi:hypothetical protein
MAYFVIYKDYKGEYRWRLKANNGEIVADSEGYITKQSAINSANWVKTNAPNALVHDQV